MKFIQLFAYTILFYNVYSIEFENELEDAQQNAECCHKNLKCCKRSTSFPYFKASIFLSNCPSTNCDVTTGAQCIEKNKSSADDLAACLKKIIITLQISNRGLINPKHRYIVVDHVIDPVDHSKVKLLNPYVIKILQEPLLQTYQLNYDRLVNGDPQELIINRENAINYLGCSTHPEYSTCPSVKYEGKTIPYSTGFCCSCDKNKNDQLQSDYSPPFQRIVEEPDSSNTNAEKLDLNDKNYFKNRKVFDYEERKKQRIPEAIAMRNFDKLYKLRKDFNKKKLIEKLINQKLSRTFESQPGIYQNLLLSPHYKPLYYKLLRNLYKRPVRRYIINQTNIVTPKTLINHGIEFYDDFDEVPKSINSVDFPKMNNIDKKLSDSPLHMKEPWNNIEDPQLSQNEESSSINGYLKHNYDYLDISDKNHHLPYSYFNREREKVMAKNPKLLSKAHFNPMNFRNPNELEEQKYESDVSFEPIQPVKNEAETNQNIAIDETGQIPANIKYLNYLEPVEPIEVSNFSMKTRGDPFIQIENLKRKLEDDMMTTTKNVDLEFPTRNQKYNHNFENMYHKLSSNSKNNKIPNYYNRQDMQSFDLKLNKHKKSINKRSVESGNVELDSNIDFNPSPNNKFYEPQSGADQMANNRLNNENPSHNRVRRQVRGGQQCIGGKKEFTSNLYDSTHCLKFSNIWYSVYSIAAPKIKHQIHLQIFQKIIDSKGCGRWRDLTRGQIIDISSDVTSSNSSFPNILVTYNSLEEESSILPSIDYKRFKLVVPEARSTDPNEILIIPTQMFSHDGSHCDKVGVGFEAFYRQPRRCDRAPGSCLANQPIHFRNHVIESRRSGTPNYYSLGAFGNLPPNVIGRNSSYSEKDIRMYYNRRHTSIVYFEIRADYAVLLKPSITAVITEIYVETMIELFTKITVKVTNNGLIHGLYYVRLGGGPDDIHNTFCNIVSKAVVIAPQQQHIFNLKIHSSPPKLDFYCLMSVQNMKNDLVAVRRIRFATNDRCICIWHCECGCYTADHGLKCISLSPKDYQAAGFQGSMPVESRIKKVANFDDIISNICYMFLILALTLLGMGLIKAILGLIIKEMGMWGLDVILGNEYSVKVSGCNQHLDISYPAQFFFNTLFFFIFPLAMINMTCRSFFSKRKSHLANVSTNTTTSEDEDSFRKEDNSRMNFNYRPSKLRFKEEPEFEKNLYYNVDDPSADDFNSDVRDKPTESHVVKKRKQKK